MIYMKLYKPCSRPLKQSVCGQAAHRISHELPVCTDYDVLNITIPPHRERPGGLFAGSSQTKGVKEMSAERNSHLHGRRTRRFAVPLLALFGLGLLCAMGPVHAQAHYCSGSGSGERVVGMSQGGSGVAAMPLCQGVDQSGAQQGQSQGYMPQMKLPDTYMTVVIHPDTSEFWATTGYGSDERARQDALQACTQTMGEGCQVAAAWTNFSQIAVIADAAGNLFVEGAHTGGNAEKNARKTCEKFSSGCRTAAVVDNQVIPHQTFPSGPLQRRPFAAIARPKGTPPEKWDDTAWLSSGQIGFKAAEDAVLSQCRHDSGMECELRVSVGNGKIARVADDTGHILWLNVSNPDALAKQVRTNCPKGRECRVIDTFDAHTPRTATLEVSKSDAPVRGFFSLARPADTAAEKAWGRRALATGRDSRDAAQQAAVALCESESKTHCEAVPKGGDRGTDQFFVLARDAAGGAMIFFGMSDDDARSAKDKGCAKENLTCSKGVTVDLAKPATTILKI